MTTNNDPTPDDIRDFVLAFHDALMRAPAEAMRDAGVIVIDLDDETPESAAARMVDARQLVIPGSGL